MLARKVVAGSVLPIGIPPLKELIAFALQNRVGPHLRGLRPGRGVTDDDLKWLGSTWKTPKDVAQMAVDCDRVITL